MVILEQLAKIGSGLKTGASNVTQFIRESPVTSGVALGGSVLAGGLIVRQITRRKKSTRKATRKKAAVRKKRSRKKKTRSSKKKRRIIRGRGLGRSEIKHSGRGTTGTKVVRFRNKKTGEMVSFKVRGTSKRRKGFVKKVKRRSRR